MKLIKQAGVEIIELSLYNCLNINYGKAFEATLLLSHGRMSVILDIINYASIVALKTNTIES